MSVAEMLVVCQMQYEEVQRISTMITKESVIINANKDFKFTETYVEREKSGNIQTVCSCGSICDSNCCTSSPATCDVMNINGVCNRCKHAASQHNHMSHIGYKNVQKSRIIINENMNQKYNAASSRKHTLEMELSSYQNKLAECRKKLDTLLKQVT
eukprot:UN07271